MKKEEFTSTQTIAQVQVAIIKTKIYTNTNVSMNDEIAKAILCC